MEAIKDFYLLIENKNNDDLIFSSSHDNFSIKQFSKLQKSLINLNKKEGKIEIENYFTDGSNGSEIFIKEALLKSYTSSNSTLNSIVRKSTFI